MIYEFNGYKPVIDVSSFVHELASVTGNVIIICQSQIEVCDELLKEIK